MFIQARLIAENKYEKYCDKFSKENNFERRIKASIDVISEIAPLGIECKQKKSATSSTLRLQADKLFAEERGTLNGLLSAWQTYSKSVAYAESDSRELPWAYANRSVILYHLRKYKECISDIDKALQLEYPDSLKANLIRRKAKCLKLLGKPEANDACQEATKLLENVKLSEADRERLEKKIQLAKKVTAKVSQTNSQRVPLPRIVQNNRIPCASNALDIKYDDKSGRHVVATRDISVGEVLVMEKPYALLLNPDHIYSHCSHCFVKAWDSIPCPNCVHAMYCSELCRDEAWKQYHDIECPIKGYFFSMNMNDLAPFSLRLAVLAIREAGSIKKLEEELNSIDSFDDPWDKCMSDGIYRSDIYRPYYCLETQKSKRMWPELIPMMLNAAIIIHYTYTATTFLGENSEKITDKLSENHDVVFVAKLIAHHYMTVQINDHGFSEIDKAGINHNLGAVIYSFSSLFNHSCNPNVTRVPVMKNKNEPQQIIIAVHPIKKGSQIFDDYGFDFASDPLSTRIRRCSAYHFTCQCIACENNWPSYRNLKPILSTLRTGEERKKMKKVLETFPYYQRTVLSADFEFLDSQNESILSKLAEIVTFFYYNSSKPNLELYESVMLLRHAFSMIYGNRLDF